MSARFLLTINLVLFFCLTTTAQGWIRDFGNQDSNSGNAVVQTPDGGYALTGQWAGANPYFLRTDAEGNVLWHTALPGLEFGYGTDITLTSDGGFAITGQHQPSNFDDNPTLLLIKAGATKSAEAALADLAGPLFPGVTWDNDLLR